MKLRKFTIIGIAILALLSFSISRSVTQPIQPPGSRTGAPQETSCATFGCHSGTANTGPGSVSLTFSGPDLKYKPGNTYQVTVTVDDSTQVVWGFEMTALEETNESTPGTFVNEATGIIISNPIPLSQFQGKRKYVGHKNANTTNNVWIINWEAPDSNVGSICFYVAGNAGNNNGLPTGDSIYTSSLCITPDSLIGIFDVDPDNGSFKISSLAYNELTLEYYQPEGDRVEITLYDLNGRLIQNLYEGVQSPGWHKGTFNLSRQIQSGLFLVHYRSGNTSAAQKVFVQK